MKRLAITGAIVALMAGICPPTILAQTPAGEEDASARQRRIGKAIQEEADVGVKRIKDAVEKGEMTEADAVHEMAEMARRYRDLAEKDFVIPFRGVPPYVPPDAYRCFSMLRGLTGFSANSTLPIFEEMSLSKCEIIRINGMSRYIEVVGAASAFPFIDKLAKDPRYTVDDRHYAYRALVRLARDYEIPESKEMIQRYGYKHLPAPTDRPLPPKLSPEDMCKVYTFILERIQTEANEDIGRTLDWLLTIQLPDYITSVQRLTVAEKFGGLGYWKAAKDEIEKVPASERKDFRVKGELLDPERKGD